MVGFIRFCIFLLDIMSLNFELEYNRSRRERGLSRVNDLVIEYLVGWFSRLFVG